MICLHFWAWKSNIASAAAAPGSFSLNTNEAPTKTRSDIWLSKKIEDIFQYKGEKSISPRVRNPSKEWRRKTHEKKLKERYLSHSYVFNLFKSSRYFWLHFLLYALSWPQAASRLKNHINSGWNYSRTLLAGTLFFFSTKVGFRGNISITPLVKKYTLWLKKTHHSVIK